MNPSAAGSKRAYGPKLVYKLANLKNVGDQKGGAEFGSRNADTYAWLVTSKLGRNRKEFRHRLIYTMQSCSSTNSAVTMRCRRSSETVRSMTGMKAGPSRYTSATLIQTRQIARLQKPLGHSGKDFPLKTHRPPRQLPMSAFPLRSVRLLVSVFHCLQANCFWTISAPTRPTGTSQSYHRSPLATERPVAAKKRHGRSIGNII